MWKEKINSSVCLFIRILGIVFVGYLFLQGLFTICLIQRVEEKTYYIQNNAPLQLGAILLAVLAVYVLRGRKAADFIARHGNLILSAVFAAVLVSLGAWICATRYWSSGDMEKVYQYAGMLKSGDYSGWLPGGYPYMWSQQNGLILYVFVLLKLFRRNSVDMVFYFTNLFCYGAAILAMFLIIKNLSGRASRGFVSKLMILLYFPYGFFVTLLYGNVIGFSFSLWAFALLLKYFDRKKTAYLCGSCACMIMAVIFKQNELIFFVGICILLLWNLFYDAGRTGRARIKASILVLLYITAALVGFGIPEFIIERTGNIEIDGGNSKWANVAMGLQECDKAPGWYNSYEEEVFEANGYDGEATAAEAKSNLADRLRYFGENPAYAWKFFNKKLASEWNNPTFECFHIQNWRGSSLELSSFVKSTINDGGKMNIILIWILDIAQSVTLFGVLMYLIGCDEKDMRKWMFVILFIGGFVFFTFWEAKCRYVIPFYLMLIPYSYPGYRLLAGQLKEKGFGRLKKACAVLAVVILFIAVTDNQTVCDAFKLNEDTEAYYEYIHEYNHNFEWLRF
jgi:hypothetical protein